MAIALSIFGTASAAFCVWLTVRIINRRERWAKWTLAVVVGLPVLYVASLGPACWLTSRIDSGAGTISKVYRPLRWTFDSGPFPSLGMATEWYAMLGAADGWRWSYVIKPAWDEAGQLVNGEIEWTWENSSDHW
jgi:hypothetical protein